MAKVLVIGSGGREHALCWRLGKSPSVEAVYCAPGNAGIAQHATCITLSTSQDIINFCSREQIGLVVIGPEQPLVEGLADTLRDAGLAVFGPSARAARLEGSKAFMKDICTRYNIPTAAYGRFNEQVAALDFLKTQSYPLVVKADGLAAGKGVIIAENAQEAEIAVRDMFGGRFGESGHCVVIEEFLEGEEVSFFALCDGEHVLEFDYAQDHKRAFDGDMGPNTGGMGTYAPPPVMTPALRAEVMRDIIKPTADAMRSEGCPFNGVLFAGLMLTKDGPKLLEYNVRFGDPETQVMMLRFQGDLYALLLAAAQGKLDKAEKPQPQGAAVCVVMAAKGYPGDYNKGSLINGLDKAGGLPGVTVFHAGTAYKDGQIVAHGGRVLGVSAFGANIPEAKARAYAAVDVIDWPEGFCRRDIGWRAA